MDTPFKRAKTRSLSTAVGDAIVHIAKLQNRIKELIFELEEKEEQVNAAYDEGYEDGYVEGITEHE